ncbi:protocadherin gamma-A11-like isoform X1 [Salminus brasiliensis]|uniref:protocadherin gamma-A11-like isoform X1 n=1 Tax=Salminus brasiliensis TaxID=930266 RepID=UPI003B832148
MYLENNWTMPSPCLRWYVVSHHRRRTATQLKWQTVFFILCIYGLDMVFSQARYSIPEEIPEGSFVGNIAKDLGIELSRLISGKARVVTKGGRQYVELSRDKGTLVVKEKIDRDELCKQTTPCSFSFDLIIENPIQIHRVTVEVQDINDNAPIFPRDTVNLEISENASPGTRFSLDSAVDMDVGINSIQSYTLTPNDNFKLEMLSQIESNKNVKINLLHDLDREKLEYLTLILIAADGGSPKKSGTVKIHISVLDVNDNAPVCAQSVYKVDVKENSPTGTVVATVNAADEDKGVNGEVTYTMAHGSKEMARLFEVNSESGKITLLGKLDYETENSYQLSVNAKDKGNLFDTCSVIIDVVDENDNPPTLQLMSFLNIIPENSPVGTTVAVINVEDTDSGKNGNVQCSIQDMPFTIESSHSDYYAIITDELLDRENIAEYNITILVSDQGSPALHSNKTLTVKISDVNDNLPVFNFDQYRAFINENNSPGVTVLTVKASDADWGPNARVSYFLDDSDIMGNPVSSLISINSDSGVIHAVRSFDYEQIKSLTFNVTARDGGSPPLSSEVMVTIVVQDQNDNAPQVLYPVQTGGSLVAEIVPRSADVGYLVTKVVAVDVDSGQNAWLSYKLQKASDRALFEVGPQNGELRTVRQVTDKDAVKQKLTVVVEDNGQPSRSAVVNINVAVADSFPEVLSEFTDLTHGKEYNDNLTFYLVLALAAVSFLFITCVVVIISVKIYRWRQSRLFYQSNLPVIPYYPPGYTDTGVTGTLPHMYNYDVCMTTNSRKSDCKYSTLGGQSVLVVDPSFTETMQRAIKEKDLLDNANSPELQKPPNNDWRLPPNQRPGPSGQHRFHTLQQRWTPYEKSRAGARPEEAGAGAVGGTGPWPNPPTEAEQLQALMAAANEVSEATATLGPRYNAQYVPDYRQNVYIPGSTATLTANPQQQMPQQALPPPQALPPAEAPKAAPTPASKKKATKKDKK